MSNTLPKDGAAVNVEVNFENPSIGNENLFRNAYVHSFNRDNFILESFVYIYYRTDSNSRRG